MAILCPHMVGFAKNVENIRIFNYFKKERRIVTLFNPENFNMIQDALFTECLKIERLIYKMEVSKLFLKYINKITLESFG